MIDLYDAILHDAMLICVSLGTFEKCNKRLYSRKMVNKDLTTLEDTCFTLSIKLK